jgi:hypothetical protein
MNYPLILITVIIVWWLYNCYSKSNYGKIQSGGFNPYGYDITDAKSYQDYMKWFRYHYPCKKRPAIQGYDNPYIYPYNYSNINMNWPVGRFKYPGWVRQTNLDSSKQLGFPGYVY